MPARKQDGLTKAIAPGKVRRGDGPRIVYNHLVEQIVTLALRPGERIEEQTVVEKLGISRTPIRQAFTRLASDGLVTLLPNRGVRVAPLDLQEVRSFFETFEIVQKAINHLAAIRHEEGFGDLLVQVQGDYDDAARRGDVKEMIETNRNFHLAIARASENTHLTRIVDDLLTKSYRLDAIWHNRGDKTLKRDVSRSIEEHDTLVRAILDRDVAMAEEIAHIHVASFREPFIEYLNSSLARDIHIE